NATAANLIERVLPQTDLRQWVLTFPFAWRRRLVDVLTCPSCHGRMKLLAMVKDPAPCYLEAIGELTELPPRSPNRGPPYWKSRVLRRWALGDEDAREGHGSGADQTA